jgi:hypothetical protein
LGSGPEEIDKQSGRLRQIVAQRGLNIAYHQRPAAHGEPVEGRREHGENHGRNDTRSQMRRTAHKMHGKLQAMRG